MTPHDFIQKWKNGGDERRDAQPFFEDICRLVGTETPREADPDHTWYMYEAGATKTSGGNGWADVWKKGYFGWEAKGTNRSLEKAYEQLKMYADALENPPLLVVTDLQTIIIHTNFTNSVKVEHKFTVEDLDKFETRQLLEAVFKNPEALRPGVTRASVTKEAAEKFTTLAMALRDRGNEPHAVAHFLNRLLFCMFAEDIGLLPTDLFTRLVKSSLNNPDLFEKRSAELFAAMAEGGDVAYENIEWFNGGLFENSNTLRLERDELKLLHEACVLKWHEIEPSIFGTLFERGLDPSKRSQLGAHYTDPNTIMKIVGPVVIEPLLREWEEEKVVLAKLLGKAKKTVSEAATKRFNLYLERLRSFVVLDPACGSGNFLYLALRSLKDIEKQVLLEAEGLGLGRQFPAIGPQNVKGIELNDYAAELARITIWIGEIQWMIRKGYGARKNPILQSLHQIETRDALLNPDGTQATWPTANVIVGNPPFLGGSKLLNELGEPYVEQLRKAYKKRVPGGADLVCYWFEKACDGFRKGTLQRAGLVSTNSIRGGSNREVLKHLSKVGHIFNAWSDEAWVNEGAAVRVSMVCVELVPTKEQSQTMLDGIPVLSIYSDLTPETSSQSVDMTTAMPLKENKNAAFKGMAKDGPFDISGKIAREWLLQPNANGRPNSDVLKVRVNGKNLTARGQDGWVIDFGANLPKGEASFYELPFQYVEKVVRPVRQKEGQKDKRRLEQWWLFGRTNEDLRGATVGLERFITTVRHSKYRLFMWMDSRVSADSALVVIARDDDTTFGIVHSRLHEIWSLRTGSEIGVGNDPRYTPTSTFETFPFPDGLTPDIRPHIYQGDPRAISIAMASKALHEARDRWLNPPEWVDVVPEVVGNYPDRVIAKPGHEADLKSRTLTNLYNTSPAWLVGLHRDLDTAVAHAYGWEWPMDDETILQKLFALNKDRADKQ